MLQGWERRLAAGPVGWKCAWSQPQGWHWREKWAFLDVFGRRSEGMKGPSILAPCCHLYVLLHFI